MSDRAERMSKEMAVLLTRDSPLFSMKMFHDVEIYRYLKSFAIQFYALTRKYLFRTNW